MISVLSYFLSSKQASSKDYFYYFALHGTTHILIPLTFNGLKKGGPKLILLDE